ncbi:hypothetical protein V8G54_014091 [Vigna mungo]|uniref:Uncharacterized protein n=1 Tax=Vigna mungo TaxID=3915 RepID=A0AAQ3NIF4_VIGMU
MIAVLSYKVIGISMILRSHVFNKCTKLRSTHISLTQSDGTSIYESRALPWLHFKNSTSWEIMGSKTILLAMHCFKIKETKQDKKLHYIRALDIQIKTRVTTAGNSSA